MINISRQDGVLSIRSKESGQAAVFLRFGTETVIKSLGPGEEVRLFRNDDIDAMQVLALAKADVAPLYVCRHVINAEKITSWFKMQGFREPVNWFPNGSADVSGSFQEGHDFRHRELAAFGKSSEVAVLKLKSNYLQERFEHFRRLGASWDYPSYEPHLTLSYNAAGKDLSGYTPYNGPILFGPEEFQDINTDKDFVEKCWSWDRMNGFRRRP